MARSPRRAGFGRGDICRLATVLKKYSQQPDGKLYRTCTGPSRQGVVLFDRVGDVLCPTCEKHNILRDPKMLAAILDHHASGFDPD